jgi:hypothetical protein
VTSLTGALSLIERARVVERASLSTAAALSLVERASSSARALLSTPPALSLIERARLPPELAAVVSLAGAASRIAL